MKVCLILHDFGADMRAWAASSNLSAFGKKSYPRPWVAIKTDKGLRFLRGVTDYSESTCAGTKGVIVRFFCDTDQAYLVCVPLIRGGRKIINAKVTIDGELQEINRDECP